MSQRKNCFLRLSGLSARSQLTEGTILSRRLSDLPLSSHKDRRKCLHLRRIEVNVLPRSSSDSPDPPQYVPS